KVRNLSLSEDISEGDIIVAGDQAGIEKIDEPSGVTLTSSSVEIAPLSSVVVRVSDNEETDEDEDGGTGSDRGEDDSTPNEEVPSNPSEETEEDTTDQHGEDQANSDEEEGTSGLDSD